MTVKIRLNPQVKDATGIDYKLYNDLLLVEEYEWVEEETVQPEEPDKETDEKSEEASPSIGETPIIEETPPPTLVKSLIEINVYNVDVEENKFYTSNKYIPSIRKEDGEILLELTNYISSDETDETLLFPEWQEVEEKEFEIPEGVEIQGIEELVIEEPIIPIDKTVELQKKIDKLEAKIKYDNEVNQSMMLELFNFISNT